MVRQGHEVNGANLAFLPLILRPFELSTYNSIEQRRSTNT